MQLLNGSPHFAHHCDDIIVKFANVLLLLFNALALFFVKFALLGFKLLPLQTVFAEDNHRPAHFADLILAVGFIQFDVKIVLGQTGHLVGQPGDSPHDGTRKYHRHQDHDDRTSDKDRKGNLNPSMRDLFGTLLHVFGNGPDFIAQCFQNRLDGSVICTEAFQGFFTFKNGIGKGFEIRQI